MDPSRTTMLRRAFARDISSRLKRLAKAVTQLVDKDDVFGFKPMTRMIFNALPGQWQFHTDDQKLAAFNKWFKGQIDAGILEVDARGLPWNHKYVESVYKKGMVRAYTDTHKMDLLKPAEFVKGTREEFLRTSFATSERVSKVRMLALRTYEELKGISTVASQEMSRVLSDGIAQGHGAAKVAREMRNRIASIDRRRSLRLARTELIHAHAEGQLDAFEDLGIEEVGIRAEFRTAGDERVCEICFALEGVVMTIAEARGTIPVHPHCRCAWIPALERHRRVGQIWGKTRKAKALSKARRLLRTGGRRKRKIVEPKPTSRLTAKQISEAEKKDIAREKRIAELKRKRAEAEKRIEEAKKAKRELDKSWKKFDEAMKEGTRGIPEYKPATSKKAAEQYGMNFALRTDYSGTTLEVANLINEELYKQALVSPLKLQYISPKGRGGHASIMKVLAWHDGRMAMEYSRTYTGNMKKFLRTTKAMEDGWIKGATPRGIVQHEIGHMVDTMYRVAKGATDVTMGVVRSPSARVKSLFHEMWYQEPTHQARDRLSSQFVKDWKTSFGQYGRKNEREQWAEIWRWHKSGKPLPEFIKFAQPVIDDVERVLAL